MFFSFFYLYLTFRQYSRNTKSKVREPMVQVGNCCSSSDDRLLNEEVEESVLRGKLDLPARLALLREQAGIEKRVKRYFDPRSVRQPHYHTQLRLQF